MTTFSEKGMVCQVSAVCTIPCRQGLSAQQNSSTYIKMPLGMEIRMEFLCNFDPSSYGQRSWWKVGRHCQIGDAI